MNDISGISINPASLQERDDFTGNGWLKILAPAKVNLFLTVGTRGESGYHDVATIMHTLALHDLVYLRALKDSDSLATQQEGATDFCTVRMIADDPTFALEEIPPADNLAVRAVRQLAQAVSEDEELQKQNACSPFPLGLRIEKRIPAQAGLGGGSSNAAAALIGAACLWGLPQDHPLLMDIARQLGADVVFFLHGGCVYFTGNGSEFVRALSPSKQSVVLVKPNGGVDTTQAYRVFEEQSKPGDVISTGQIDNVNAAAEVPLINNLSSAAESINPELRGVREWLIEKKGSDKVLLCGSGASYFALCDTALEANALATAARQQGWWARSTSLCRMAAQVCPQEDVS